MTTTPSTCISNASLKTSRSRQQHPQALGLGLRTAKPPDTLPPIYAPTEPYNLNFGLKGSQNNNHGKGQCEEVSDQEWELRTGRAIYVLQETLPNFFHTGLITCVDATTGAPKAPNSTSHHSSGGFHIPIIDSAASLDFLSSSASSSSSALSADGGTHHHHFNGNPNSECDEEVPIYSPNVRLQYEPPVVLPAPFPKTFKLEGLQMYLASSSLLRHTMNTLYSDLEVTLTKISVHNEPPSDIPPSESGSGSAGTAASSSLSALATAASTSFSSHSPCPGNLSTSKSVSESCAEPDSDSNFKVATDGGKETNRKSDLAPSSSTSTSNSDPDAKKKRLNREKYVLVRQLVTGVNRVSGKPGEWEVESLYAFSPLSGLILKHTVNSIQPAPHIAVYDSLKMSLGKMFGFGGHHAHPAEGSASPTPTTAVNGSLDQ